MKVSFFPASGSSPVVLADTGNTDPSLTTPVGTDGFKITGRNNVQRMPRTRASHVKTKNRQNTENSISFNVTRNFGSLLDAETFCVLHNADVQSLEGTVQFEFTDPATGVTARGELQNASMETFVNSYKGKTVFSSYTIIGGKVVRSTT